MVKFMLDPGHDLNTPGKGVAGLKEFTFNKAVALKMKALLEQYENVKVIMSHNLDDGIDQSLASRAKVANDNNVDAVVSIHANAARATSARGIETFIHPKAPKADSDLALALHTALIKATKAKDRGIKKADFQILRDTKAGIPVCLVEGGFMTNAEDFALLISDAYRNTVAQALTSGLATLFKLKKKDVTPPAPKPAPKKTSKPATSKLYKVQVGAFSEKSNADRLSAELKAKGYSTYIVED